MPQAASRIGVSAETLRRWIAAGRVTAERVGGRNMIPVYEVQRLAAERQSATRNGRNRVSGIVTSIELMGLMGQVELVSTEPVRLVALITSDASSEMGLEPGLSVEAIFRATSVFLQRDPEGGG